jgi:outer membrane protein OmpA-like peptidoglycan-associated protein
VSRFRRFASSFCLATLSAGSLFAQEQPQFAVDRYRPAERGSRWFASESLDATAEHPLWIGATYDWAHRPLTVYDSDGSAVGDVIRNQSLLHLGFNYSPVSKLRLGANLPIIMATSGASWTVAGRTYRAGDGGGLGDFRLGGDYRILGEPGGSFRLAASLQVFLPIGSSSAYASDGAFRIYPRALAAGDAGPFVWALGVGTDIRTEKESFAGRTIGSDLGFTASIGAKLADGKLTVGPELFGSTRLASNQFFEKRGTPVELLFGGHGALSENFLLGVAAGPGLSTGLGSPASRLLVSLDYSPTKRVREKPPSLPDTDRDGFVDPNDACPTVSGVYSDDPARRGCPAPKDTDGDRIIDTEDACPTESGVTSTDQAKNGCPAPKDADNDGVYDETDACPMEPGIHTALPATDGCPPPKDSDGDTIFDEMDACPNQAGPTNADRARNGCPVASVVEDKIIILERVEFDVGQATLRPESDKVLGAVLTVLNEHPEITRLRVEGHTDNQGNAQRNLTLSRQRAAAVVKWLIERKVDAKRLTSQGFGQAKPLESNTTELGRQNNRRVEFHIEGSNPNPSKATP